MDTLAIITNSHFDVKIENEGIIFLVRENTLCQLDFNICRLVLFTRQR
jgi:hypothetical protein